MICDENRLQWCDKNMHKFIHLNISFYSWIAAVVCNGIRWKNCVNERGKGRGREINQNKNAHSEITMETLGLSADSPRSNGKWQKKSKFVCHKRTQTLPRDKYGWTGMRRVSHPHIVNRTQGTDGRRKLPSPYNHNTIFSHQHTYTIYMVQSVDVLGISRVQSLCCFDTCVIYKVPPSSAAYIATKRDSALLLLSDLCRGIWAASWQTMHTHICKIYWQLMCTFTE